MRRFTDSSSKRLLLQAVSTTPAAAWLARIAEGCGRERVDAAALNAHAALAATVARRVDL